LICIMDFLAFHFCGFVFHSFRNSYDQSDLLLEK
jgi:hypothetical protein